MSKKSIEQKVFGRKRFRVTRYKVNKGGKLSAARNGWVCKARDVEPVEAMMALRDEDNKRLRASANKLEAQNIKLNNALELTRAEMSDYRDMMRDAVTMLEAYDTENRELIVKLHNTINRRGYWGRLWRAVLGRT